MVKLTNESKKIVTQVVIIESKNLEFVDTLSSLLKTSKTAARRKERKYHVIKEESLVKKIKAKMLNNNAR